MKHNHPPLNEVMESDWQSSVELKLPISSSAVDLIRQWLQESLHFFKLRPDFLTKVVRSAQDALARVLESPEASNAQGHIHLRLFIPKPGLLDPSEGQSWGFFRIEKTDPGLPFQETAAHYIDFYLYVEN